MRGIGDGDRPRHSTALVFLVVRPTHKQAFHYAVIKPSTRHCSTSTYASMMLPRYAQVSPPRSSAREHSVMTNPRRTSSSEVWTLSLTFVSRPFKHTYWIEAKSKMNMDLE